MRKLLLISTLALVLLGNVQSASFEVVGSFKGKISDISSPGEWKVFTSKDPSDFAEILCFIWRFIELICVLLLLIDVIMRATGKALYFIHASRFIVFAFGASSLLIAGIEFVALGTRGYLTVHFSEWMSDMYNDYLGWRIPIHTTVFNAPADNYFMFINVTFYEQIILTILILTWGIMKLISGKSALMSKAYHCVKSLFLVFFISFMFPLYYWGGMFWRQNTSVGVADGNRKYFGYLFNWFMLLFWFLVGLFLIYSMIKTALDQIDGDQTVQANYEKPDFVHERNELTDAEGKPFLFAEFNYFRNRYRTRKGLLH